MKKVLHKHRKRTFLSFLSVFIILLVLLKLIGWHKLYSALLSVNVEMLGLAFILSLGIFFFKTGTWHVFLVRLGKPLKYMKTLVLIYATQFFHAFIPLGAITSKPVSAYLLNKSNKIPTEKSLAAITIADFLRSGFSYILAWVGLIFFMIHGNISYISWIILGLAILIGTVLTTIFLVLWEKEKWLDSLGFFFGHLASKVRSFFKGKSNTWEKHFKEEIEVEIHNYELTLHKIVNNIVVVFKSLLFTAIECFFTISVLYVLLYSLGFTIPWYVLVMILPLSSLAAFLPLPGGFGGVEITMGGLLILLAGVPAPEAAVVTLLFRVFCLWIPVIFGVWAVSFLTGKKINPKDVVPQEVIPNN